MNYLVDTNVWLEVLLSQEGSDEAQSFLRAVNPSEVSITDFSVYSIGIKLIRLDRGDDFRSFLEDTLKQGVRIHRLDLSAPEDLIEATQTYHFDFDDAYQYAVAEQNSLTLVSFDKHFDRAPRGRMTPGDALRGRTPQASGDDETSTE